jgi:predicted nucleic acid-binding protein
LVIDASVAVKWVLPEDGAERAAALRGQPDELIAPTLIAAEIGSTMRKQVAANQLAVAEALSAAEIATGLLNRLVPIPELAGRALELAIELRHPIYDCFYLALAEREDVALVTADKEQIAKAKRVKIKVRPL